MVMKTSVKGQYALAAMAYTAAHDAVQESVTVTSISDRLGFQKYI